MLINNFLQRVSIAEILTALFIGSVGLSILYKYGFYEELGISWYVFTLSPQQLFLSSINLIFFSILGILMGALNSFYNEKYWEIAIVIIMLILLSFLFSNTLVFPTLKRGMYIFMISAVFTVSALNFSFYFTNKSDNTLAPLDNSNNFFNRVGPQVVSLGMIVGLLSFIYFEGKAEAERLTLLNTTKSIIKLKNNDDRWILIDMNGDKALMIKDSENREFKIVEYKEIESFKVN